MARARLVVAIRCCGRYKPKELEAGLEKVGVSVPRWLHLIQAGVYAYTAWEFGSRFLPDGILLGVASAAQLASVAFPGRQPLYARLNLATLLVVTLAYARFVAQGLHVYFTFGQMAGDVALGAILSGFLALPWLFAVAAVASWPWRRAAPLFALALLPLLDAARPYPLWLDGFGETDAHALAGEVAGAVWGGLSGGEVALPAVDEHLLVVVTPWSDGKPQKSVCASGNELSALVAQLARPAGRGAVVVDIPWRHLPAGWLSPGRDAPFHKPCPQSPATLARSMPNRPVMVGWTITGTELPALRFASAMASDAGVVDLDAGWARGADLSSDAIREAVRAGAHHLMHGMNEQGRFSYIVKGPGGEIDKGYNYPRHAGTTWFLARAAAALGDEEIGAAADKALDHLVAITTRREDGAWFIDDPMRKDKLVWVGTTGLATAAASLRPKHRDTMIGWAKHVALGVDELGQVRNEANDEDGDYNPSDYSAYAQGQGMLALAVTVRALGEDAPADVRAALDRSMALLVSGRYLGSTHPMVVGDEHWTCITAHALADVYGLADDGVLAAQAICKSYLTQYRVVPSPDGWRIHVGGGGGIAEAIIADAYDTHDARSRALGEGYAAVILRSQFLPQDAPLLGGPEALTGGFRQAVGNLNVQIDVVQHASSALLSWLAVMEDKDSPGFLP